MSTGSKIEWTEATWNPVTGCSHVSAGCDNCYAAAFSHRLECMGQKKYAKLTVDKNGHRQFNGEVRCHEDALEFPLTLKKPSTIFVCSMSDLFHPKVPDAFRDKVHTVAALCPQHTLQVLTKRPEQMAEYLPGLGHRIYEVVTAWLDEGAGGFFTGPQWDAVHRLAEWRASGGRVESATWNTPLPNVWLGTTVENAEQLPRIAELLKCPAAVRFLSLEPLLGPIDLQPHIMGYVDDDVSGGGYVKLPHATPYIRQEGPNIHWIIVGGESGPGARPCAIEDIRSIIEQCRDARVPVFVKQLGANPTLNGKPLKLQQRNGKDMAEWPADLRIRELVNHTN